METFSFLLALVVAFSVAILFGIAGLGGLLATLPQPWSGAGLVVPALAGSLWLEPRFRGRGL